MACELTFPGTSTARCYMLMFPPNVEFPPKPAKTHGQVSFKRYRTFQDRFFSSFLIFPYLHRIPCLDVSQGSAGHRGGRFEDEGYHCTRLLGQSMTKTGFTTSFNKVDGVHFGGKNHPTKILKNQGS